jgi:hypothetical protein
MEVHQISAEKITGDEATFEADSLNVPFLPVDLVFEKEIILDSLLSWGRREY